MARLSLGRAIEVKGPIGSSITMKGLKMDETGITHPIKVTSDAGVSYTFPAGAITISEASITDASITTWTGGTYSTGTTSATIKLPLVDAQNALNLLKRLHRWVEEVTGELVCGECGYDYPCDTLKLACKGLGETPPVPE